MPEELLNKADIKGIQDLVHSIQANLDCVQPRRDIKVKQMQLALDIGFRLVRSSLLEKKLAGIGMIKVLRHWYCYLIVINNNTRSQTFLSVKVGQFR
jgi:hypothetical protein